MLRGQRLQFSNKIVFLYLKINFVSANSVVPAEMPHNAAFHPGLLCLPNYAVQGGLKDDAHGEFTLELFTTELLRTTIIFAIIESNIFLS